jgi:hypothetical protein
MRFITTSILICVYILFQGALNISSAGDVWSERPHPFDRMREAGIKTDLSSLVTTLTSPGPTVNRYWSALALAQLNDPAAVSVLVDVAKNDLEVDVRLGAISALGHFDSPTSSLALEDILTNDSNPSVRKVAVISIGQMSDMGAEAVLFRVAGDELEPQNNRLQALTMIGQRELTVVGKNMLATFKKSDDADIRASSLLIAYDQGVPWANIDTLVESSMDDGVADRYHWRLVERLEAETGRSFGSVDETSRATSRLKIQLWKQHRDALMTESQDNQVSSEE